MQMRGTLHLRLGELPKAIADFDRYIALAPRYEQQHWQRGIAYYLSDRYQDAIRQFDMCRRFDTNDIENAVWQFISVAKTNGIEKARASVPTPGNDRRPILNDVYAMLEGRLKPEELLKKAEGPGNAQPGDTQSRFAAHYYLGLYYDVLGDQQKSLDHLRQATKFKSVDNIMNDVARVQIKLRSAVPVRDKPFQTR
jgi:tetratricopeptide (TPR) repeat protein